MNGKSDRQKRIRSLRLTTFRKNYPKDLELNDLVKDHQSHFFLRNPAGQRTYIYLTEYIKAVAEFQFSRPASEIKILDWGAGKGHVSYLLRKQGTDVTACDIENKATDSSFNQAVPILAKTRIPVTPLLHPYKLPFENASFDVVLSVGVLEHVPEEKNSLVEISRVLKKNGLFLCFFLPQKGSWIQRIEHLRSNYYHTRLYDLQTIKRLLSPTGLELIDYWHRSLFPKNRARYPFYHSFEIFDQLLCKNTILKYTATNIEFVAIKNG